MALIEHSELSLPLKPRTAPGRHRLVAAVFTVIAFAYSSWLGTDANWDLLNYHFYSGEAALSARAATDIAAAHRETYFFPGADMLFAGLRHAFGHEPHLLAGIMAIPEGIACYLAWRICLVCLPDTVAYKRMTAFIAVLFGATGAAGLPTIGTTMSDMLPISFFLAALTAILEAEWAESRVYVSAGALLGISLALKLTLVYALVGFCVAVVIVPGPDLLRRIRNAVTMGAVASASYLVLTWWWLLRNETLFGNPLFPLFNDIFRSSWVAATRLNDDRFRPATWFQALIGPLRWAHWQSVVTETPARDIRLSLAMMALFAILAAYLVARVNRKKVDQFGRNTAFLSVLTVISFIIWEKLFSILRYLSVFELLAGIVIVAAPALWLKNWRHGSIIAICVAFSMAGLTTIYPFWSFYGLQSATKYWPAIDRFRGAGDAIQVSFPELPAKSLVIEIDDAATGYLAVFAPQDVVFVGANNNIIHPGDRERLAQQAEAAIRTHLGPLWSVDQPIRGGSMGDETLAFYGLQRGQGCVQIHSNLDDDNTRLCPLQAQTPATKPATR